MAHSGVMGGEQAQLNGDGSKQSRGGWQMFLVDISFKLNNLILLKVELFMIVQQQEMANSKISSRDERVVDSIVGKWSGIRTKRVEGGW